MGIVGIERGPARRLVLRMIGGNRGAGWMGQIIRAEWHEDCPSDSESRISGRRDYFILCAECGRKIWSGEYRAI